MLIDCTQANNEKFPTCQKKTDFTSPNEGERRKKSFTQSLPKDILDTFLENVNKQTR